MSRRVVRIRSAAIVQCPNSERGYTKLPARTGSGVVWKAEPLLYILLSYVIPPCQLCQLVQNQKTCYENCHRVYCLISWRGPGGRPLSDYPLPCGYLPQVDCATAATTASFSVCLVRAWAMKLSAFLPTEATDWLWFL